MFFVEEPVAGEGTPALLESDRGDGIIVVQPVLPSGLTAGERVLAQRGLLNKLMAGREIRSFVSWYYTPIALEFSDHLKPVATIYDCMDELSAFRGAPRDLLTMERKLFDRSDVVFAGGASLFEAKRSFCRNVRLFPSSVDTAHFAAAREALAEPLDQAGIPQPRLGYFGVIDERMDFQLLANVADARPDWHLVLVGPVAKICDSDLPQRPNLHYLGPKPYAELPAYLATWKVALIPFALNASTRYISPTKTPEYLAAGRPVVSTPITDVVKPYAELELVSIARTANEFVCAVQGALSTDNRDGWLAAVDHLLESMSWDVTWSAMSDVIDSVIAERCADPVAPSLALTSLAPAAFSS